MDGSQLLTDDAVTHILCDESECRGAPNIVQEIDVNEIHSNAAFDGAPSNQVECKFLAGSHFFNDVLA
jgi:hypothetical protein